MSSRLISYSRAFFFSMVISGSFSATHAAESSEVPKALPVSQESLTQTEELLYQDIAGNLRCPTCVGVSVLDSAAGFSEQIKQSVRRQIKEGKSEQAITDFFVDRYGPWILRAPPAKGFDLLAWLVPLLLLMLGPLVIWVAVWRKKQDYDTQGIRSTAFILDEMESSLRHMRERGGA